MAVAPEILTTNTMKFLNRFSVKPKIVWQNFKGIISSKFPGQKSASTSASNPSRGRLVSRSVKLTASKYKVLIIGEQHIPQEKTEASKIIAFCCGNYPAGTFRLIEESTGGTSGGAGLLSNSKAYQSLRGCKISVNSLPDNQQFFPEKWLPQALKTAGTQKKLVITYTGNAHTTTHIKGTFGSILPTSYNLNPGKTIRVVANKLGVQSLVIALFEVNGFLNDFELKAWNDFLKTYPSIFEFNFNVTHFKQEWNRIVKNFDKTYFLRLAKDVYMSIITPYKGLQYVPSIEIAWRDSSVRSRIVREKTWTLYDVVPNTSVRFQNTGNKNYFLKLNIDPNANKVTSTNEERY